MNSASVALISNGSATGTGHWPGGLGVLTVAGTFGGTAATLEYLADGAAWLPVKAMAPDGVQTTVSLAANGTIGFALPPGQIRCVLTGGTPSAMYATAARVPE
jgi:hypothetical protein